MKNKYWIDLHYALRLERTITVKTLKTIVNVITTCLIITTLSSCTSTHSSYHKVHIQKKVWDSYKTCSAYGTP